MSTHTRRESSSALRSEARICNRHRSGSSGSEESWRRKKNEVGSSSSAPSLHIVGGSCRNDGAMTSRHAAAQRGSSMPMRYCIDSGCNLFWALECGAIEMPSGTSRNLDDNLDRATRRAPKELLKSVCFPIRITDTDRPHASAAHAISPTGHATRQIEDVKLTMCGMFTLIVKQHLPTCHEH